MFLRSGGQCGTGPPRIGGVSLNLDSPTMAEDNENTAEMSTSVVLNPDVLHIIFAHLNVPNLKTVRLVCHGWHSVASILLGKSTRLTACKLFDFSDNKLSRAEHVDAKLTRKVYASSETGNFDKSIPIRKRATVMSKVISSIVSPVTQDLTISIDRKKCVTPVVQGMKKLKGSNLRNLDFSITMKTDWGENAPAAAYEKRPTLTTLTSIRFKLSTNFAQNLIHTNSYLSVQPILQGWLDSAPNLTSLDIFLNFYPNLESCKNLKIFKFKFARPAAGLDLGAVTGMLTQIKDSVENVELDVDKSVGTCLGLGKLDLPVMPHVVTLFADDLYHIFDTLDEQRLPKLKHLKLEKAWHERRDSDSMELCKGHRGVESITMILCCTCDQVPETIVKLFPNVKEFDLTWKLYGTLDFAYLVWFMDPFKFWNLDLAKLSMEGVRLSGNLVAAIGVMSTWKGLKIAKVSAYLTRAGFTNVIEDLIDISADFKTLDIQILSALGQLPLGDEFMEELRSMIAAKGAPMTLRKA